MLPQAEMSELQRRIDAVIVDAARLSLRGTERSFVDQVALVEIDALDAKLRLSEQRSRGTAVGCNLIDRDVSRIERRCAALTAWLAAHGPEGAHPARFG